MSRSHRGPDHLGGGLRVEITLHSPGGHTSRPHLTSDLVYGMGTVITGLPGVLSRRLDPRHCTVMVGRGERRRGGERDTPDRNPVRHGSHREPGYLAGDGRHCPRDVSGLLVPLGIEHSLQFRRGVPPVVNEERSTQIMTHAIEAVGPEALAETRQSGGGEDFSWYLEDVPGAMARLGVWSGVGEQLDLHQPTFDLDERALAVGVRVLVNVVEQSAVFA